MKFLGLSILIIFFALSPAFAISSEEAQSKAAPYVADSSDLIALSKPLRGGSVDLWLFFYSIYSPKRILVAVTDDENAEVLSDEQRLSSAGQSVYSFSVIEEFVKKNGWGFSSLEPVLASSANILVENDRKLSDFSSSISSKYPDLDFYKVQSNMQSLSERTTSLQQLAVDGEDVENLFQEDYDVGALHSLETQYSASFRELYGLLDSYDAYSQSISDVQRQAYQQGIPDPDFTSINKNLESLRDVGLSDLYSKTKREKPKEEFEQLLSQSDTWVNDSVTSFVYRKNKVDAIALFEENQVFLDSLLTAAAANYYAGCGREKDFAELKKRWVETKPLKTKSSAEAYAQISETIPDLVARLSAMRESCDTYYENLSKPSTVRKQPPFDAVSILIVLVLIGAAAYFYNKTRMPPEAEGMI